MDLNNVMYIILIYLNFINFKIEYTYMECI